MAEYQFCPYCTAPLEKNDEGFMACSCGFVHWDNPVPVVACVIPMQHYWLKRAGIPTDGIPDGGIVIVERGNPPFVGGVCLPSGFMNKHGLPKAETCREILEETGLVIRIERMLCACNPMPGEVNQIVLSYLARPVGGILRAGSDAKEVYVVDAKDPRQLCFRSHRMLRAEYEAGNIGALTGEDLLI
jgi:ADP-ribose pyrophosphatase YjhB (NUDIX family)